MRQLVAFFSLSFVLTLTASAAAQVRRPMPVVQRIEPTAGPPGTTISLIGRHFDNAQTVWLGESQLQVQSRLPNRWTVTVTEGARSGNLQIRTSRGNVRGPRFRVTEPAPAPSISGFDPAAGSEGTEVTITGENFSPRTSENHVRLGGSPVVVRRATPTELHVIVPAGATTGPWRVRVSDAGETTSSDSFTIGSGTAIASFEPAVGPPRTRVTIRGTGFDRNRSRVRVYLGEARARVIRATETELQVEVPRRNAESGRWLVDVRGGGRATSSTDFQVRYAPTIASTTPAFGAPGIGQIRLEGEHFGDDPREVRATIGGRALRLREVADDHVLVQLPQGAEGGRIEVTVAGLGPAQSDEITITRAVAIDGFTPRSGGAGSEVTVLGHGFSTELEHNVVTVSGQRAEVVSATEERLVFRAPDARSGPVQIAVTNGGEARTRQPFVVTQVPQVASFEPASGPPGTAVVIRGTNFGTRRGLVRVAIGERNAQVVSVTNTELRVVIPQSAETGTLRVTVRMQGAGTSEQAFEVTSE